MKGYLACLFNKYKKGWFYLLGLLVVSTGCDTPEGARTLIGYGLILGALGLNFFIDEDYLYDLWDMAEEADMNQIELTYIEDAPEHTGHDVVHRGLMKK